MIELKWCGRIGYGDIMLAISYAHNLSLTFQEEVNINFLWHYPSDYKYNKADPEYLWQQAEYLNSICEKSNIAGVSISHTFNDTSGIRWSGYDQSLLDTAKFHNHWLISKEYSKQKIKKIVIGSSLNNLVPLEHYNEGRKKWKLFRGWEKLNSNIESVKEDYEIVYIDYRTPISELVNHLLEAELYIGYHGGLAWIARFCKTPSCLLVNGHPLSKADFFNSLLINSLQIETYDQLQMLICRCDIILDRYLKSFDNRQFNKKLLSNNLNKVLRLPNATY